MHTYLLSSSIRLRINSLACAIEFLERVKKAPLEILFLAKKVFFEA